jgi:hypothetical protein
MCSIRLVLRLRRHRTLLCSIRLLLGVRLLILGIMGCVWIYRICRVYWDLPDGDSCVHVDIVPEESYQYVCQCTQTEQAHHAL